VRSNRSGPGRPRKYCKRSCRQRDFEARSRASSHGLDEGELIVARSSLERLRDELYVLSCAVEDAETDLLRASSVPDHIDVIRMLLAAARPLCQFRE
jgi:hypothetical protein